MAWAAGPVSLLSVLMLGACSRGEAGTGATSPYEWQLPRGFPTPAVPADNPMSANKVALGRRLFFDARLSMTGQYSCASCHDPSRAFTDGRAAAVGATGQALPHSAMSLVNVAYNISFGWTQANVRSLEAQMREPLLNEHPIELGLKGRESSLVALLSQDASYSEAFATAFAGERSAVSFGNVIKAIAAYERTLISGDSAFDRYVFSGDHAALSDAAKRGMKLFFSDRTGCSACHSGFNFAGSWRDSKGETGEPTFARSGTSKHAMRVPTLRNISITAPYMHDGRFASLDAVLDHYADSSRDEGPRDAMLRPLKVSPQERQELMAFLRSLTSSGAQ